MEIQSWQIKSIYALAGSLNMVEHGSHDDTLHELVQGMSGKASVKALTKTEADTILAELRSRMKMHNRVAPLTNKRPQRKKPEIAGGVTSAQQNKCWRLMYELERCDAAPSQASTGARLCGIIKRQFGVDAAVQQPFRFLRFAQGRELIEILKQYVDTAALKACHREAGC